MKLQAVLQVSHSGFLRCMLGNYAHTGSSSVQNDLKRYFGGCSSDARGTVCKSAFAREFVYQAPERRRERRTTFRNCN